MCRRRHQGRLFARLNRHNPHSDLRPRPSHAVWCTQVPGMRKWLKFERSGRTEILQVDKHAVALQTGVQVTFRSRPLRPSSSKPCQMQMSKPASRCTGGAS